jgi:hypothetical protein
MKNLKRILDLIRKTGHGFIFEDEEGQIFVILPADDYENIILKNGGLGNLSEQELLNKINKDIAVWRDLQKTDDLEENWQNLAENKEKNQEEDQYYFEPADDEE